MPRNKFTLLVIVLLTGSLAFSQTRTQTESLRRSGELQAAKERAGYEKLKELAQKKKWPLTTRIKNGGIAVLTGTNIFGNPVYLSTESNQAAAATIGTNQLYAGGSLGLALNGSSASMTNKVAVWDGGSVRATHVELGTTRVINQDASAAIDHSTHVAGTMIAKGTNPLARGMSWGLQSMSAYDFNNHHSEILNASANLLISNHSYGERAGWVYNEDENRWEFWGPYNMNEDPIFGLYTLDTQLWDSIAYMAPYYLIVKSAGNNRDENGPAVGAEAYRYNESNTMTRITGGRPASLSSNDGYDIISSYGNAKNILTVGAVNPIPLGYSAPSDVMISSFSSWGPTDDGRIKPDIVGDGVNLYSCTAGSDNAYGIFSGTSMAAPNISGSLILLQEYYTQLHPGTSMRAATLKGLAIHTADEAGPTPGPDYIYGWGLANIAKAATMIKDANEPVKKQVIREEVMNNGVPFNLSVIANGNGPLKVTICWTDPKGTITPETSLNDRTPKLIHDLDLRITEVGGSGTTFYPWVLDPANPSNAATQGDNKVDNVEQIVIPNAVPGRTYNIVITHKSNLARWQQAFSLLISGVGGTANCASGPTDANGTRINRLKIANLNYQPANTISCTQYVDNTASVANVEQSSTYAVDLTIGSCSAGNLPAFIVKCFVDLNANGTFDTGEELFSGGPFNPATPTHNLSFNIPLPATLNIDNSLRMRVVVAETNNPASITACNSYTRGETHDILLKVIRPSKDLRAGGIIAPFDKQCANGPQNVSIVIRNNGTQAQSNIPVTLQVKEGANTVLNTNSTFPGTIPAESEVVYTIQNPFTPLAGVTYTITASTNFANDQNNNNNQIVTTLATAAASAPVTNGTAEICGTNTVNFSGTPSAGDIYFWYDQLAGTVPIAAGTVTNSTVITANKKYYVEKNSAVKAGPAQNNSLSTTGRYSNLDAYFLNFTTTAPVIIESARMYVGRNNTSGKLTVTVARNLQWISASEGYRYNPVSETTVDIYSTDPNPVTDQGYQADDPGAVFLLNLPVPDAGNYVLIISQEETSTNAAQLFYNSSLTTSPYPTGIRGLFNITGDILQYLDPPKFEKYYFAFYNFKLRLQGCQSSARQEVTATTATTPVITQLGDQLSSSLATGNQWYVNNNPITGAKGQTYKPTTSGVYKVLATNQFGCALQSNEINFGVTSIPNVDPAAIGLKILPNPSNGRFVADFTVTRKADLNITILNTLGQKAYETNYPGFIGRFNRTIEAAHLTTGVYMLRIQHDNKSYLTKLIIR